MPELSFREIVSTRHAARGFDGSRIPEERIHELLDLIRMAPSSFNLQPWRAVVIGDGARKQALAEAAWKQPQVTTCSHLFVFCANTDLDPLVDRLERKLAEAGTPGDKARDFTGMIRGFLGKLPAEARLPWAQRQTYLALGNGLNGACSLGLDTCPMEGFQPDAFARILDLPETLVPTVLMAVGRATDEPRPKVRFSRDEMFLLEG